MINDAEQIVNDTVLNSSVINTVWHDSVGYYFPKPLPITLSVRMQNGNWHEIADPYTSENVEGKIFKLWINHGINATASTSYEYYVIPGISQNELNQFALYSDIEVIANQSDVQAVKLKDNSLIQFVFHKPTRMRTFSKSEYIETKSAGLVMLEKNINNDLIITVSDPTQTLNDFNVIVSGRYTGKQCSYNSIKNQTEILITLPQKGEAGSSVTLILKRK